MNGVARNWVEGETIGKNFTSVAPAPTKVGRVLDRQIFTTSRLADFASRSELERQTGHSASFWPEVVLKETIDMVSGTSFDNQATDQGWQKWKPTDPTSAHWYDLGSLKTLIAAEVNWAQRGNLPQRPVRDFIADFRGLAGTGKRRQICEAISASRKSLDTYFYRGDDAVNRLLKEMNSASKSVKPRDLGVIGKEHILASLGGDPECSLYK